jgi:hypothetical protein
MNGLWTPPVQEDVYVCLVCGEERFSILEYERHVSKCMKMHEHNIEEWRKAKRPEPLFGEADPEYREWQRKTGKLI